MVGKLTEECQLTRRTIASILQGLSNPNFGLYKVNPEDFIAESARLINEQKATVIVEHLTYDMIDERYDSDIFTREKPKADFSKAMPVNRHVYEYIFTDSKNEREFVRELDSSIDVVVYAKLPKSFYIPTPVGNYSPDWAIRTTHKVVEVVTTNYDRLVEYAACQARSRCNTGFSEGALRHFQCQKSDINHYTRHANFRCVDVWKVHGSIDWFQNGSASPVGVFDHAVLPETFEPLLVTPGVAKYSRTHQEPFRSVISFADSALSGARGFLCIGYGFSDDHIEPKLIQRSADVQPPIAILARELRPGAKDFLSKHLHSNAVAFEKEGTGTIAYTSRHPNGIVFPNEELWSLEGLLYKLRILP